MSEENNKVKAGRGRPAGSTSFVRVRMKDLINIIGDMGTVPVSKVWLRENGIEEEVNKPLAPISLIGKEEPEEKIEFSLTTFED